MAKINFKLRQTQTLNDKFVISPIQSLPLTECDRLPETMGAFLVTNFAQFAYIGSSTNLKKRFDDLNFLEKIQQFETEVAVQSAESKIEVFWIECDRYEVISKIEQQLLAQFNHLTFLQYRSSPNK